MVTQGIWALHMLHTSFTFKWLSNENDLIMQSQLIVKHNDYDYKKESFVLKHNWHQEKRNCKLIKSQLFVNLVFQYFYRFLVHKYPIIKE